MDLPVAGLAERAQIRVLLMTKAASLLENPTRIPALHGKRRRGQDVSGVRDRGGAGGSG